MSRHNWLILALGLLLIGIALLLVRYLGTGPVPSVCIAGTWHLAGPDCPP
jgi:hypothetical protein